LHVEALELLELYVEVLHARLGLLDAVYVPWRGGAVVACGSGCLTSREQGCC
jgi:hypothetical protein